MSKTKNRKHMSQPKVKGDNLPSLQKMIVLHLAENTPQTVNQTVTAISKSYKPTWLAFNSLKRKKLIVKANVLEYRGRKYPRYWLTDEGIIMALMEGANAKKLLERTKSLCPDAEITHCFLEIMPLFDPEVVKMAYSNVKGKGKLGPIEVVTLILSGAAMPMEIETGKKVAAILKKYPVQYALLKNAVELMIEQLKQLIAE
jgi:hypothetical protein